QQLGARSRRQVARGRSDEVSRARQIGPRPGDLETGGEERDPHRGTARLGELRIRRREPFKSRNVLLGEIEPPLPERGVGEKDRALDRAGSLPRSLEPRQKLLEPPPCERTVADLDRRHRRENMIPKIAMARRRAFRAQHLLAFGKRLSEKAARDLLVSAARFEPRSAREERTDEAKILGPIGLDLLDQMSRLQIAAVPHMILEEAQPSEMDEWAFAELAREL